MTSPRLFLVLPLALFLSAGCDPAPCVRLSDCPSDLTCSAGACVVPPMDGSADLDAGHDAGRDAPAVDGAVDAPPADAGRDAP